ncbi:MAG: hypothetical protein KJ607_00275, partial [Bacteroidetes bacterium]|nr:hypothetical protein [Bacteroidota bacterium]
NLPDTAIRMKIYGDIYADMSLLFPGQKIDLIFLEEAPLHFRYNVLTEGEPLYITDLETSFSEREKTINLYRDWKYFIDEFYNGLLA